MTGDPDPFEQGQRAARENIPADGNPYQDGSQEHALWAAGPGCRRGRGSAIRGYVIGSYRSDDSSPKRKTRGALSRSSSSLS